MSELQFKKFIAVVHLVSPGVPSQDDIGDYIHLGDNYETTSIC